MTSLTGSRGATGSNIQGRSSGDKIPKGYSAGQLQQFTPEQMKLMEQMFSHVGPDSYLSRLAGGDQSFFEEMEKPAWRQFQQTQGDISSRFSGMGLGGRHGSGFQNQMTQAGSDFAQDLQSRRQQMQMQAIKELMGLSNDLLDQRPQKRFFTEKQQKQSSGWGPIIGTGVGAVGGFFAGGGNPMTALQGAQLGYNVGSGF